MPEVYVHAVKGRSVDQKRALVKDITDAVVKNLSVPLDAVMVEFIETDPTSKAKGGVLFSDAPRRDVADRCVPLWSGICRWLVRRRRARHLAVPDGKAGCTSPKTLNRWSRMGDLDGKTALVTGAAPASGSRRSNCLPGAARRLRSTTCRTIRAGRRQSSGLRAQGLAVIGAPGDVAKAGAAEAWCAMRSRRSVGSIFSSTMPAPRRPSSRSRPPTWTG